MLLRCVEWGRLELDEPVGRYYAAAPEPNATFRQVMTHTSVTADGLAYSYRPGRLDAIASVVARCAQKPFPAAVGDFLEELVMYDSVPGASAAGSPADAAASPTAARYQRVLARLATPYAVDAQGRATPSRYATTTLGGAAGLISTVRDVARFDLAIKKGFLRDSSLVQAWTPPVDRNGKQLPHGLGWFVQSYNGELVVWQFGVADNASSSMIIMLPRRSMTVIMLANSDGLVRGFPLGLGEISVSPFAKLFLGIFVR
jgi:CubicO group peptidase (beta-lactamase class C family)